LRRDILDVERENLLYADKNLKQSYVEKCLEKTNGPILAATDYIKLFPDQIRAHVKNPFYVLGTDGYGRSDTRKQLRHHFEVDAKMIAYTALKALADQGDIKTDVVLKARKELGIDPKKPNPALV